MKPQRVFIIPLLVLLLGGTTLSLSQEPPHPQTEGSLDSLLSIRITVAGKYWQTIGEAPASVSIITSSDIERFGYQTLEDLLNSVRSFYVSNDRNYSYAGVRGFSRPTDYNNRVLLLINGHTVNENVYGSAPLGTDFGLSLNMIDRVEVVRGPGSALYGTSAMFAVVNIVTKKGKSLDGLALAASAGSYRRLHGSLMWGKEFERGIDVFVAGQVVDMKGEDLYFKEFDTDSTNHGIANGLDWDRYYGIMTTVSFSDVTLQGMINSREKGIPTASFGTAFNNPAARTLDQWQHFELKWQQPMRGNRSLMLRGYYDHYKYEGTYPYDTPSLDASDGIWLGGELQYRWDLAAYDRLIIGTEYQRHPRSDYRLWYHNALIFDRNVPFSIASLYLQNEYQPSEAVSLTIGIRHDSYSTFGSSTNPRAAIIYYPLKGSTLKLLYGTAFRAPNFYEVYYTDPTFGAKENLKLKPETIRTAEIIWEQRLTEELFGIISVYDYKMENLIDQRIDPVDSLVQFQNVNRVKARGLELELNARFRGGLHGYVNVCFLSAQDAQTNLRLTNSPDRIIKAGVSYLLLGYLETAVEALYETDRKTVYGATTNGYLLTNVNLTSTSVLNAVKFSLLFRNVFDISYKLPGGLEHKQHSITQQGRNVVAKLEVRI